MLVYLCMDARALQQAGGQTGDLGSKAAGGSTERQSLQGGRRAHTRCQRVVMRRYKRAGLSRSVAVGWRAGSCRSVCATLCILLSFHSLSGCAPWVRSARLIWWVDWLRCACVRGVARLCWYSSCRSGLRVSYPPGSKRRLSCMEVPLDPANASASAVSFLGWFECALTCIITTLRYPCLSLHSLSARRRLCTSTLFFLGFFVLMACPNAYVESACMPYRCFVGMFSVRMSATYRAVSSPVLFVLWVAP